MNKLTLAATVIGLLSFTPSSHAQIITWGAAQTMVGDTDVSAAGTAVDAATFFGSSVTVNTVAFNPITSGTDGVDIAATTPGGAGPYTNPFSSTSPSSTNYSNLTSVLGFGFFQDGTVTLSNLKAGDTYQVQVWSWDNANAQGSTVTQLTGATSVNLDPSVGQYSIGTFTLPTATTSETFNYDYTTDYGLINAISLRDVTGASATPEPSTYVLASLGFLVLVVLRGRFVRSWY